MMPGSCISNAIAGTVATWKGESSDQENENETQMTKTTAQEIPMSRKPEKEKQNTKTIMF